MSTNTITSELQRNTIMEAALTAFAAAITPLNAFSTVFQSVPLAGTNKVEVPYYPLVSAASTDFVAATGYTFGDTSTSTKEVTVNKRKFQSMSFTSDELRRQAALDPEKLGQMKGQKLAEDVLADIWGSILAATFGNGYVGASSAFGVEDVIDIRKVCEQAKWPKVGRSLILNGEFDAALMKDTNIRLANSLGDNSAIREGNVGRLVGFDYYNSELVPANGENLVGFAAYQSALLVAFSPIEPAPGVRQNLSAYEVMTAPSGITIEYRAWGDPDLDTDKAVLEVNYGSAAGEAAALKRIATA
jgi:hypothetical protein